METFLMLRRILRDLTWRHASSFITELAFTLVHFFEEVKPPPQGARGCSFTLGSCDPMEEGGAFFVCAHARGRF